MTAETGRAPPRRDGEGLPEDKQEPPSRSSLAPPATCSRCHSVFAALGFLPPAKTPPPTTPQRSQPGGPRLAPVPL